MSLVIFLDWFEVFFGFIIPNLRVQNFRQKNATNSGYQLSFSQTTNSFKHEMLRGHYFTMFLSIYLFVPSTRLKKGISIFDIYLQ